MMSTVPLFAQQYSTFHHAALEGSLSAVSYFLNAHGRKRAHVKDLDHQKKAALHYAAEHGHTHVVLHLLEMKCPVDICTEDGMTPMMFACKNNMLPTITCLFEHKANLLLKNRSSMTAIHFACVSDHKEAVTLCYNHYKTMKDALVSKETGAEGEDDSLVDEVSVKSKGSSRGRGMDTDDQSMVSGSSGSTSKSNMKKHRRDEILKLPDNIILEMACENGMRPLHFAAMYDSTQCLRYLLEQRVDVNAVDNHGDTALHKAARNNLYGPYRLLEAAGARQTKNKLKETPHFLLVGDSTW